MQQLNSGNYSNAIAQLTALDQMYPGSYKADLNLAIKCRNLSTSAKKQFNEHNYTAAENLYSEILRLNKNDKSAQKGVADCQTARQVLIASEYENCHSINDYKNFIAHWPDAPQADKARKIVNDYDLLILDNSNWTTASNSGKGGTIVSYTRYLSIDNPQARHIAEAYLYRARLYYKDKQLRLAKWDYESASGKGAVFSSTDSQNYQQLCAILKFGTFTISTPRKDLMDYKSACPGYYTSEVNGLILESLCRDGLYDQAKCFLDLFGNDIKYPTTNGYIYWTTKQWKQHIQAVKQNSKQKHSTYSYAGYSSSQHKRSNLGWMLGVGASIDWYKTRTDTEPCALFSPELSVSMGDFYNLFNLEVKASFKVNGDGYMINLGCSPRCNLAWRDGSAFFVQPEVSYDFIHNVLNYGGRVGLGSQSEIGVLSFSPMYNGYLERMTWGLSYTFYFGR